MSQLSAGPASFVGRSSAEVISRLISKLPNLTDYTYLGEGSVVRAIMESIASEIGNAYAILDYSYGQQILSEATGMSLDSLGILYNVTRRSISAVEIQKAFYFYLASSISHQTGIPSALSEEAFIIPKGTIVGPGNNVVGARYSFETTDPVTFGIGDSVKYVGIKPIDSTITWNVPPHSLRVHNYDGDGSHNLYCTNPAELISNAAREPDSVYRARIMEGIRSLASSNTAAIRLAALSVDHVRDVRVFERPYGPATVKVVFATDYGERGYELAEVADAIEKARPIGTYVEAGYAEKKVVSIKYSFLMEDDSLRKAASRTIDATIKSYMGSLPIGQPLRRSQLIERMFTAVPIAIDANIVEITIDGLPFIGDVYKVPEDGICELSNIMSV